MTISRLPNGRWRSRVWSGGKNVPVSQVLGTPPTSYRTKTEARDAYDAARKIVRGDRSTGVTVRDWWERWTTKPVYQRPKASTNIHNRERTKAFVERYGSRQMSKITRQVVNEWREDGGRDTTIPPLHAMWNDAIDAGVVESNPFHRLGIAKSKGNRFIDPPSEGTVWQIIRKARDLVSPFYAAWLQVGAFTGMRSGELDALRWERVDFDKSRIHVAEQYSSVSGSFTLPKNGKQRHAPLTKPARDALLALPKQSEFCFINLRGHHWTAPGRAYHWGRVRAAADYKGTSYVCTRHFAAWYMLNVLDLSPPVIAIALGHEDGGRLIETVYGHRDRERSLDRVVLAYESRQNVVSIDRKKDVG